MYIGVEPVIHRQAEAVAEGIKAAGQEAELLEVGNADAKQWQKKLRLHLDGPAMGAEDA